MDEIFRGDTLEFDFSATDKETGENYVFKVEDILKCGIKKNSSSADYYALKVVTIAEASDIVHFEFTHEEMKDVGIGSAIIEVELNTSGKVYTIYQEEILIKGDIVNE